MSIAKIQPTSTYLYTCKKCLDRFVGYGDKDKAFQKWRDNHVAWHKRGNTSIPNPNWLKHYGTQLKENK